MRTYSLSLGQAMDHKHPHPERTASRRMGGVFSNVLYQVWPNRGAMARSIRMQQKRAPEANDWHALVKLGDAEGY